MGFFKGLFGSDEDETPPRNLDHPRDLQQGDMLKFGFSAEADISGETFTVKGIETQDLGGEQAKKCLFDAEGASTRFRLSVVEELNEEWVEVARPLLPDDVLELFEMDAFVALLDEGTGVNHVLERTGEPERYAGWSCGVYRQEAGHNAYLHEGDFRKRSLEYEQGEAFSYYRLVSDDRLCALEVQVYDGGRTDVWLCKLLPLHKVEELWPAH